MIESIGCTEDGKVWMKVLFEIDNKQATLIIPMTQDKARQIGEVLSNAADEAQKYNTVMQ